MGKKFRNIIKMIKNDKRFKYTLVVTIMLLFISIIGYSLSFFNKNSSMLVANIKVNDLSFNITTNSGESDDRVLHLKAGYIEQFNVTLTSLNEISSKYELTYKICNDSGCSSTFNLTPEDIFIGKQSKDIEITGTINSKSSKDIILITKNTSNNDYYIKLDLNVGYIWNNLALENKISNNSNSLVTNVIAYVDGIETNNYPNVCSYKAEIKGYINNEEIELKDAKVICDLDTKEWTTSYKGYADKIIIYFTKLNYSTFAEDSWDTIVEAIREYGLTTYPVGSEKKVEISKKSYTVRVANNTTPIECNNSNFSQTACGFVVEFVDVVEKRGMNSEDTNVGGWKSSEMRSYLNGQFFKNLPEDLQKVIIDTTVISGHGTRDSKNFTTTDKIYLLSSKEINLEEPTDGVDTATKYTRTLGYYIESDAEKRKKKYNNSYCNWYLRSPEIRNANWFVSVENGNWNNVHATDDDGAAPAFRIG